MARVTPRRDLSLAAARLAASGLLVASVIGLWGAGHWTFDLLSHFRLQYVVLRALLLVGLSIAKLLRPTRRIAFAWLCRPAAWG